MNERIGDGHSLILASTSHYRRSLLARLGLPFAVVAPEVAETPLAGEAPRELALRLAEVKSRAVALRHPGALVIGSDQVAEAAGQILGKPGHRQGAVAQLQWLSGKRARFWTGLCLCRGEACRVALVPYDVSFRELTAAEIQHYVDREQPFDCAGSFKAEGLGVALFRELSGEDPTALMGLPLIRLCRMLGEFGVAVL